MRKIVANFGKLTTVQLISTILAIQVKVTFSQRRKATPIAADDIFGSAGYYRGSTLYYQTETPRNFTPDTHSSNIKI